MKTKTSDLVREVGRDLVTQLERESPLYGRLLEGNVTREKYAAFLVQHHKYVRLTHDLMVRYAARMAASSNRAYRTVIAKGADRHAAEEKGHDHGVLEDLAHIWSCSVPEALERVDGTDTAPSLRLYAPIVDAALEHDPGAIAGLAAVLETVASSLCPRAHRALLAGRPFPEVEDATRFLVDHSEDGDHVEGGMLRLDLLEAGRDACAAIAVARATAVIYRELWRFMDERIEGGVEDPAELAIRS